MKSIIVGIVLATVALTAAAGFLVTPSVSSSPTLGNDGAGITNLGTIFQLTSSVDYTIKTNETVVHLAGNKSATLPTAIGNTNRTYTIICTSSGTNAILTVSAQTISGFTKWTNTAVNKFVTVVSNNTNWFVISASVPP